MTPRFLKLEMGKTEEGQSLFCWKKWKFLRSVLKYFRKIQEKGHSALFKVWLANYLLLVPDEVNTENRNKRLEAFIAI